MLKTLLDVWDVAAERMIITVARRLARGITQDGWAERKAREVLGLRDELRAINSRLDITAPDLADQALAEAYTIGQRVADTLGRPLQSRSEFVDALARRLVGQLAGAHLPVIHAHEDLYRRAVRDAELLMQIGAIVRRDAVPQVVDRSLPRARTGSRTPQAASGTSTPTPAWPAGPSPARQSYRASSTRSSPRAATS
ncbi:hypothetical protein [Amycolatopsis lexingtonensis]|uniref:hypothetical protein n=1 Tax=Amycolatopsis lexingtonensis TaxID=218822 RepID=UPI003F718EDD